MVSSIFSPIHLVVKVGGLFVIFGDSGLKEFGGTFFLDENPSTALLDLFPIIMSLIIWGKASYYEHVIL